MDALNLLLERSSSAGLAEPAPDAGALRQILAAALRAPDHGRLRPFRFLVIEGQARQALGHLFAEGLAARKPGADEAERHKALNAPLRAPMILVVAATFTDHPKVPKVEQLLTAACAAHAVLYALQALGYGGLWRTGDYAYDPVVRRGLGLKPDDEIVGYLYVGTPVGRPKPPQDEDVAAFTSRWAG